MKIKITICALLCFMAFTSSTWCKRGGAPIVEPVIYENIKYISPNDDGIREYIQVWDIKAKRKIWEHTIFANPLQPGLEKDVQWVFIEKMKLDQNNLLITDEHARQFTVDLKTKQIKRLK